VVAVEVIEEDVPSPLGRLVVRARQPRGFFQQLARLVLEEWFEVHRLEALDESTAAVLGYLLGGSPAAV
jgi:ABC-2 type transport system ATP-binding protein